jgi:hypothetical protein
LLCSFALLLPLAGCTIWQPMRSQSQALKATRITPTRIDYVDADAFDVLLENALKNEDAAIVIPTGHAKPDWGDRLNAWIGAWNMAGRTATGEKFRMQAPFVPKVVVDGDSIREFRLLIDDLMNRIDERTRAGLTWLSDERMRNRRVKLLKPYNLRFHMADDGTIQIVLFNGRYADSYQEFVRALEPTAAAEPWERTMVCSMCAMRKQEGAPTRLTSRGQPDQ